MIQMEQNWLFFKFNEIKKLLNETSKSSNNEKNPNLSLATDKDVEFAIESHWVTVLMQYHFESSSQLSIHSSLRSYSFDRDSEKSYFPGIFFLNKIFLNNFFYIFFHSYFIDSTVECIANPIFTLLWMKKIIAAIVIFIAPPTFSRENFLACQHRILIKLGNI